MRLQKLSVANTQSVRNGYRRQMVMNEYCYYVCGADVPEIRFETSEEAWEYIVSHEGYDCVVESRR